MMDPTHPLLDLDRPWLTYGLTPPKINYSAEKRKKVATAQSARIRSLPVDALVMYDLQDESSRTDAERPFPFMACIDPADYAFDDLADVSVPKIVYRSVAEQTADSLSAWLHRLIEHRAATVLVGSPSQRQRPSLALSDAYRLHAQVGDTVPLGGVAIAERHDKRGDEHLRVLGKLDRGCRFLISQAVYSVTASKNFLSDLYFACEAAARPVPRVLVTLSPCGSEQTLAFMRWLGIAVPRWLENELVHSRDILQRSVELSLHTFAELQAFGREKGFQIGCNVESVSLRKAEIDASVELVHRVHDLMKR